MTNKPESASLREKIETIVPICPQGENGELQYHDGWNECRRFIMDKAHDIAAMEQDGETVAWEATTPVYRKYVSQRVYAGFSPEAQKWYRPYRCAACASRPATDALTEKQAAVGVCLSQSSKSETQDGLSITGDTQADAAKDARIAELESLVAGYQAAHADKLRLTRMLDVELNGEEGAAQQASLCDLIGQPAALRARLAEAESATQSKFVKPLAAEIDRALEAHFKNSQRYKWARENGAIIAEFTEDYIDAAIASTGEKP